MKISNNDRSLLREAVNKKIGELVKKTGYQENIKRLVINPEMLNILLFNEHVDIDGVYYKTIEYHYGNLKYIDLSNADFRNVSFDNVEKKESPYIFLDFTNANIDFSKSYEWRKYRRLIISHVSFESVDLSVNNRIDEHGESVFEGSEVSTCNFINTNLKINTSNIEFYNSKLRGVDLSEIRIHSDDIFDIFENCDLRDTGLRIGIDDTSDPDDIRKIMTYPKFEGCFIGERKIIGKYKKEEMACQTLEEYKSWRDGLIKDVVDSLDQQISQEDKKNNKKSSSKTYKKTPSEIDWDEDEHYYQRFIGYNG